MWSSCKITYSRLPLSIKVYFEPNNETASKGWDRLGVIERSDHLIANPALNVSTWKCYKLNTKFVCPMFKLLASRLVDSWMLQKVYETHRCPCNTNAPLCRPTGLYIRLEVNTGWYLYRQVHQFTSAFVEQCTLLPRPQAVR